MKKLAIFLSLIVLAIVATAQPPQAFKYQTVIRDGAGNILPNQEVALLMSIHDASATGAIVYQETFIDTTNQFGLVNLEIGKGTPTIGTFTGIDWASNSKFLEVEIDPEGGNEFVALGTSELESVPYAMHAETVTNVDDADADPTNETNTSVALDGTDLKVTDAGGTITTDLSSLVDDPDADPANEIQSLSINGNELSISNGNMVPLPTGMPVGTAGQTINHEGNDWAASDNLFNDGTNVGIGTTTPGSKLEVAGAVRASSFVDAQDADFYIDPSGYPTSGVLNGHLGIGSAPYWVPGFPMGVPGWGPNLHINTGQDTAYLWIGGNISQSGADLGYLSFIGKWNNSPFMNAGSHRYASINAKVISGGSQTYYPSGALIFSTATGDPFTFPSSGTGFEEQMRITHEGNVGIGTNDPWDKLHLEGGRLYVNNPGGMTDHGVYVENAGGHGYHVYNAGSNGFNVLSAGDNGLNVTEAVNNGVLVSTAHNYGIDASGNYGNHLRSQGTGSYGLVAHSLWDEPTNPGLYVYGTAYITGTLSAPTFSGNGSTLTNLNAANISSGTLNNSRFNALSDLGGGSGTTFLRKDGSWASPASTTYSAGNDLNLSGTTFSLDNDIDVNYLRATGSSGLKLFDDGGKGIYIRDGGNVGIGVPNPEYAKLCIHTGIDAGIKFTNDGTGPYYSDGFLLSWISGGNSDVVLWNRENTSIVFATNNSEKVRIKENGYVGIGTPSPGYKLHVNGTAYATGAAGALSDIRHKKNIQSFGNNTLEIVGKLRPVSYEWKNPLDNGMQGVQFGFIAQEVEEILPSVVLTEDNDERTKALKYSEFIPVLVKAIQELKTENETLKARIEKLEDK